MLRREFLIRFGTATLASPMILQVVGCGDDDDIVDVTGPEPGFTVTSQSDTTVHSHRIRFTCSRLSSGSDPTFTSDGDHIHSIDLTPDEQTTILGGGSVTKGSTFTVGHNHTWTIVKTPSDCS